MKKIYRYMMVAVAATMMTACSESKLDIEQRGATGTEVYTQGSENEVNAMIAAVYSKIHGDAFNWFSMGGNVSGCAKSMRYELGRMGGELAEYYKYDETSESVTYSMVWAYYYKQAYWCNMIIENVPNNTTVSETLKTRVVAEARAIRAIAMMNLVQLFGNPPLADHVLTGSEPNTPAAESWAFIESELKAVADLLPSKASANGQAAIGGRLTREAVYAYLGKAYLWEKKYNEAAQTLYNNVIATNKYALEADYSALRSSSTDFSAENIWEFDFNDDPANASAQEGRFDVPCFGLPTQIAVPDDWSQSQAWGYGAGVSAAFGQFMAKHDVTASGEKSNRYRGTVAAYEDLLDETIYSYNGNKGVISQVDNCEGYFNVKYQPMQADIVGGGFIYYQFSKKNTVYMRYSEVLLNYAEAVAQGGSAGSMSGLEALNLVRRRAGLADAPALDMDNADYGVKAERQAELFYEGCRFIDLVRWGDAPTVLANSGKTEYKFLGYKNGDNTTIQSPAEYNILETPTVGVGFKAGKNELFPIPQSDCNNNPSLQQNPGW